MNKRTSGIKIHGEHMGDDANRNTRKQKHSVMKVTWNRSQMGDEEGQAKRI